MGLIREFVFALPPHLLRSMEHTGAHHDALLGLVCAPICALDVLGFLYTIILPNDGTFTF